MGFFWTYKCGNIYLLQMHALNFCEPCSKNMWYGFFKICHPHSNSRLLFPICVTLCTIMSYSQTIIDFTDSLYEKQFACTRKFLVIFKEMVCFCAIAAAGPLAAKLVYVLLLWHALCFKGDCTTLLPPNSRTSPSFRSQIFKGRCINKKDIPIPLT